MSAGWNDPSLDPRLTLKIHVGEEERHSIVLAEFRARMALTHDDLAVLAAYKELGPGRRRLMAGWDVRFKFGGES